MWSAIAAAVVIVVGGVSVVLVTAKPSLKASPAVPATPARTASGATDAPPWPAPADPTARAKAAGLGMLSSEGSVEHIHSHLTVTVDGQPVPVPALIGVDENAQTLSPLHTHDASGILHVESPVKAQFTLGQVFTEWNVALSSKRIGSLDTASGDPITAVVNGKKVSGDPAAITLADRADIDIVVTRNGTKATPPPPFTWPSGY